MAAFTDQDARADIDAYQPPPEAEQHPLAMAPPNPLQAVQVPPPAAVTPSWFDSVVSHVDQFAQDASTLRSERDVASGAMTGAVNAADTAKSAVDTAAAAADKTNGATGTVGAGLDVMRLAADSPIYQDARNAVLRLRDAVAVKDPGITDHLLQGAGQLVPSFLMFSRVMGAAGVLGNLGKGGGAIARVAGNTARFAAADAANSAIMIGPHDPRTADMIQLLGHTEGKYIDLFRSVVPGGVRDPIGHYIDFLADRGNESEAMGRFKNVLDGYGAAAAFTGVLGAGASILKQGHAALHFMADNNVGKLSDFAPKPPAAAAPGKAAPKMDYTVEDKNHTVTSDNGVTRAVKRGNALQVISSETFPGAQGRGEGTKRIAKLVDQAHAQGMDFNSDSRVSPSAAKVYDRLEKQGYTVRRNEFEKDEEGNLTSNSMRPVFQVLRPGEK